MINPQGYGHDGWHGPYTAPLFTIYEVVPPCPGLQETKAFGHRNWTRIPERYELESCSACVFMWPWFDYEVR